MDPVPKVNRHGVVYSSDDDGEEERFIDEMELGLREEGGQTEDLLLASYEDDAKRIAALRSAVDAIMRKRGAQLSAKFVIAGTTLTVPDMARLIMRVHVWNLVRKRNISVASLIRMSSEIHEVRQVLQTDNALWRLLWMRDFFYMYLHFSPMFHVDPVRRPPNKQYGTPVLPEWVTSNALASMDERYSRVPWRRYYDWCTFFNRRCLKELVNLQKKKAADWLAEHRATGAIPGNGRVPSSILDRRDLIGYMDNRQRDNSPNDAGGANRYRMLREQTGADFDIGVQFRMIPWGEKGHDRAVEMWELAEIDDNGKDRYIQRGYLGAMDLYVENFRELSLDAVLGPPDEYRDKRDTHTVLPAPAWCQIAFASVPFNLLFDDLAMEGDIGQWRKGEFRPLSEPEQLPNFYYRDAMQALTLWYLSSAPPLSMVARFVRVPETIDEAKARLASFLESKKKFMDDTLHNLPVAPMVNDMIWVGRRMQ